MADRTLAEKRVRVERNLKASLLINESLILRAYSVLESNITEAVLTENINLLETGLIIPEYRLGSEILLKEVDKHLASGSSKKTILRKKGTAEILDSLKTKSEVDGDALSQSRSFCLALLLFRLVLTPNKFLKRGTTTTDLLPLFEHLFHKGIPPRKTYIKEIKRLFVNPSDAVNLVQSVYFGVGAQFNGANPVWSQEINPHKCRTLDIWLKTLPVLTTISQQDLVFAKRFGITDFLEENQKDIEYLNEVLSKNQHSEQIADNLRISERDLDLLSFNDVLDLRKTAQFKNFNDYIYKNKNTDNYGVTRDQFYKQKKIYDKREKTVEVCWTVAGFIPHLGHFLHILTYATNLLFKKELHGIMMNKLPVYSFSEAINHKVEAGIMDS